MGAGLAIVSTPYLYARELLAGGRGLLVPPASPEALAESLSALLLDPDRREAIAAARLRTRPRDDLADRRRRVPRPVRRGRRRGRRVAVAPRGAGRRGGACRLTQRGPAAWSRAGSPARRPPGRPTARRSRRGRPAAAAGASRPPRRAARARPDRPARHRDHAGPGPRLVHGRRRPRPRGGPDARRRDRLGGGGGVRMELAALPRRGRPRAVGPVPELPRRGRALARGHRVGGRARAGGPRPGTRDVRGSRPCVPGSRGGRLPARADRHGGAAGAPRPLVRADRVRDGRGRRPVDRRPACLDRGGRAAGRHARP